MILRFSNQNEPLFVSKCPSVLSYLPRDQHSQILASTYSSIIPRKYVSNHKKAWESDSRVGEYLHLSIYMVASPDIL